MNGRPRLPVIRSSHIAECGLVCIAMVASYHGRQEALNQLRTRFPISASGLRLRDMISIANDLNLSTRALKVPLELLSELQSPAILHWKFQHFVVLESVGRRGVVIHDPSQGRVRLSFEQVSASYTGVALELSPTASFEKIDTRERLDIKRIVPRIQGGWGALAQILVLSAALQLCGFVMPLQIQLVVDQAIGNQQRELLPVVLIAFVIITLLQAAIEGLRNWTIVTVGNHLSLQIVTNLIVHLIRLPTSFFERRHSGDILSRIGSIDALQEFITRGIISIILDGIMAIAAGVILFLYSTTMTFIVVGSLIVNFILANLFFRPSRRLTEELLNATGEEQTHMIETVEAASLIKVMGAEPERIGAWRDRFLRRLVAAQGIGKFAAVQTGLRGAVSGLQTCILIYVGANAVMDGDGLTIGMLMAFLAYAATFSARVNSLVDQAMQARLLGLHLERVADIVDAEPEAQDFIHLSERIKGRVKLREVSFRYGISDRLILDRVDLQIEPNDFVAIVGATGAGKTTLLKILLGLHAPVEGEILLDGRIPTAGFWRAWRRQVGYVAQDDFPLSGTAAENIAFFDPDLDIDRVVAAAKRARIHDDIIALPLQYSTAITHQGLNLSGGQRQRLMLARALYRDPQLLILDEGTANLDLQTEEEIADMVCEMALTRIIVAHRPSLVARAAKVFQLSVDGTLVPSSAESMFPNRGNHRKPV